MTSQSRMYSRPTVSPEWYETRNTHPAVAVAIHAIADSTRSAEAIWEEPTSAECDHVAMAVADYLERGDFSAEPDGLYPWGDGEPIRAGWRVVVTDDAGWADNCPDTQAVFFGAVPQVYATEAEALTAAARLNSSGDWTDAAGVESRPVYGVERDA